MITEKSYHLMIGELKKKVQQFKDDSGNKIEYINFTDSPEKIFLTWEDKTGPDSKQYKNPKPIKEFIEEDLKEHALFEHNASKIDFQKIFSDFKDSFTEVLIELEKTFDHIYYLNLGLVNTFLSDFSTGVFDSEIKLKKNFEKIVIYLYSKIKNGTEKNNLGEKYNIRQQVELNQKFYEKAENALLASSLEIKNKYIELNHFLLKETSKTFNINFSQSEQGELIMFKKLGKPQEIKPICMNDSVCFAGRGILKDVVKPQTFFSLDQSGCLQKFEKTENGDFKLLLKKKFELGGNDYHHSFAISPSGINMAIGGYFNKTISVLKANFDVKNQWKFTDKINHLMCMQFVDDQNFCAGFENGILKIFDTEKKTYISKQLKTEGTITAMSIGEKSNEIMIGTSKGRLFSININDFQEVWYLNYHHKDRITSISPFPQHNFIITCSYDKSIIFLSYNQKIIERIAFNYPVYNASLVNHTNNLVVLTSNELCLFEKVQEKYDLIEEKEYKEFANNESSGLNTMITNSIGKEIYVGTDNGAICSVELLPNQQFSLKKICFFNNNMVPEHFQ